MSSVITVMNMKGGVGKTTVAMHLGGALAMYYLRPQEGPRKVLLIDYDPQFNLSQAFLPAADYFAMEKKRKHILSVLVDDGANLNPYTLQVPGNLKPPSVDSVSKNIYVYNDGSKLDLVPSTLDLMYVALGRADAQIAPIEERFKKFIDECRAKYDLIIIDCHPAGSIFTKTSLANSDHVLIPVVPQRYATRGIGLMMRFIQAKSAGAGPTPHILFNLTSRTKLSQQEIDIRADKNFAQHCLRSTLKKYAGFSDPEEGAGFVWKSKKSYSGEAVSNLKSVAREFVIRIGV